MIISRYKQQKKDIKKSEILMIVFNDDLKLKMIFLKQIL